MATEVVSPNVAKIHLTERAAQKIRELLEKEGVSPDVGGLRVRTIAAKDCPCDSWPGKQADGKYHPAVVLDLDYWLLVPQHQANFA